jgi:hypothetical protein
VAAPTTDASAGGLELRDGASLGVVGRGGGAVLRDVLDEPLHLGDLAALGVDDLLGEFPDADVLDAGAFAREDGDGVV